MTELTKELERWDELTAAEKNALVAVHVMGWKKRKTAVPVNGLWVGDGAKPHMYWSPTTDANDMRKAVQAFMDKYFGQNEWELFDEEMSMLVYKVASHSNSACAILVPLSNICLAMLQALAESEKTDDDGAK